METKLQKYWPELTDEEKTAHIRKLTDRFKDFDYEKERDFHDRMMKEKFGDFFLRSENPVVVLRLVDPVLTNFVMEWMFREAETSKGKMTIPFAGFQIEEIAFDKGSLMGFSDSEKGILMEAMRILKEKGVKS